ncbi:MAG: transketolase [Cytophagales bacterium]|nr:transketolase [Cytophagales bacterium]
MKTSNTQITPSFSISKEKILEDFKLVVTSRETSNIGYKEVHAGKASFGIFGGGKELPQVAMAHFFNNGDFRSGYYRDQTLMFAIGEMTPQQLFSQLYAHPDIEHEPVSAGRLMTGHFGTRSLNDDGSWKALAGLKNSTTDVSPTAGQMPRLVGLAYASKLYRENKHLENDKKFSLNGQEIAFGTIGNGSTAEGLFFESLNAGGVLQVPMLVSIWDDDYGISVPNELQVTKGNISEILSGFQRTEDEKGFEILRVKGWDYPTLIETYEKATKICREEHVPVVVHVTEITQPNGHSTSGSHTRYKSKERLDWEAEYDCLAQMKKWIISEGIASSEEVEAIIKETKKEVRAVRKIAWDIYQDSINQDARELINICKKIVPNSQHKQEIIGLVKKLSSYKDILRKYVVRTAKKIVQLTINEPSEGRNELLDWVQNMKDINHVRYSALLYNESGDSSLNIPAVPAQYDEDVDPINANEVLNQFFDIAFERDPKIVAFGEDVGKIGDVNKAFDGMQDKYGELRVSDTGIRECTIIGQAIGLALRGFRPIAEIQYVDYILYAIQTISDDLATLHYRSFGGQKAPVIIRTRGHRLEGIWHSGSPMGTLINSCRGMYLCVPRNMTQATGFYNTLLQGSDPAIVVECLNGYRLKERVPSNLADFTVPLGIPEVIRKGEDITIVTYGAMCGVVEEAAKELLRFGISCEVIDVQTLIPFDINHSIVKSIQKTNRVLFADEDVPGGATGYMMQQVLEEQNAYLYLDAKPKTISSWAHRPAYAVDGGYFSKPNIEDVFEYVYEMISESNPRKFPPLFKKH